MTVSIGRAALNSLGLSICWVLTKTAKRGAQKRVCSPLASHPQNFRPGQPGHHYKPYSSGAARQYSDLRQWKRVCGSCCCRWGVEIDGFLCWPVCQLATRFKWKLNGLLRQYIPKKRPLSTLTEDELKMIQDRINHRPRKRLGFKTPYEVFHQSLKRVALRTWNHHSTIRPHSSLDYQTPLEYVSGWKSSSTTGAFVSKWKWSDKTRQVT